jgi:hypothetical protein
MVVPTTALTEQDSLRRPPRKSYSTDTVPNLRSHLPRNRTRSVTSSPSPSPPPSPQQHELALHGVPNAREKRRSFSTRPAVGRPFAARSASFDDPSERTPDEPRKRRRESHSGSRPRHVKPSTHRAEGSAGNGWLPGSYSTHAEASVSSFAEEEDESSSGTETERRTGRNAVSGVMPTGFNLRAETDPRLVNGTASPSEEEVSPSTHGLHVAALHGQAVRSASNGSESDASRRSIRDRLRSMVTDGSRDSS